MPLTLYIIITYVHLDTWLHGTKQTQTNPICAKKTHSHVAQTSVTHYPPKAYVNPPQSQKRTQTNPISHPTRSAALAPPQRATNSQPLKKQSQFSKRKYERKGLFNKHLHEKPSRRAQKAKTLFEKTKPIFPSPTMNISSCNTSSYVNHTHVRTPEKQSQTKPISAQKTVLPEVQTVVTHSYTKAYVNVPQSQKQTQTKPICRPTAPDTPHRNAFNAFAKPHPRQTRLLFPSILLSCAKIGLFRSNYDFRKRQNKSCLHLYRQRLPKPDGRSLGKTSQG